MRLDEILLAKNVRMRQSKIIQESLYQVLSMGLLSLEEQNLDTCLSMSAGGNVLIIFHKFQF